MTAIMLDNEEADEQSGRGDCDYQGQPVAVMRCRRHDHEQCDKRRRGRDQLKDAPLNIGAIALEPPRQHRSESVQPWKDVDDSLLWQSFDWDGIQGLPTFEQIRCICAANARGMPLGQEWRFGSTKLSAGSAPYLRQVLESQC